MKQYVIYHEEVTYKRKPGCDQFHYDYNYKIYNKSEILRVDSENEAKSICKTLHQSVGHGNVYYYEEVEI